MMFDRLVEMEEGDEFKMLGEDLRVEFTKLSAAHREVMVYGQDEDATEMPPKYEIVLDARYDSFEVFSR